MGMSNLPGVAPVPASVVERERPRRARLHSIPDVGQVVLAGLRPEDGEHPVIVDLEDRGREGFAGARADAALPVDFDPAHRAPVSRAGSRLMPLTKEDRNRSGSPVTSRSGSRSNRAWNVTAISRRARWAPRQKRGPCPPKPTCGLGSRARSKTCGSAKTAGSRLAAA